MGGAGWRGSRICRLGCTRRSSLRACRDASTHRVGCCPLSKLSTKRINRTYSHAWSTRKLFGSFRPFRVKSERLELVNRLLGDIAASPDFVVAPARQLQRLSPPAGPGISTYDNVRPTTPLSEAALLTNTRGEPNLNAELKAEIDTADQVDLLCAFVKWHGVRLLEAELARLQRRGAPFRIITTTYMGATERAAIDRLAREFGAQVRVQYDSMRTRLHAKAWLFRRRSAFNTAYVGSSNLSKAALLDGVEWNVRLSGVGTPALLEKFQATFDTYWNDASYEVYDPDHDQDRDRLDDALAEASGTRRHDRMTVSLSGLEVRPYPYQLEMLDALDSGARRAWPPSKSRRCGDGYRQNGPGGTRLPATRRLEGLIAFYCPPKGDSHPGHSYLPRSPGRRELR